MLRWSKAGRTAWMRLGAMASCLRECPCAAWVGYGLPNLAQKREKVGVWLTVGANRAGVAVQRRRREDGRRFAAELRGRVAEGRLRASGQHGSTRGGPGTV